MYDAVCVRVVDGDTIKVDWDLGAGVWLRNETLRLYGIDAPELRGQERPKGQEARKWLADLIEGKPITIRTLKDKKGKYGRYLATVWFGDHNVNQRMIQLGLASETVW